MTKPKISKIEAALKDADYYYQLLGQFVLAFASTEVFVANALWHLAGVKEPTAQAVFSGVRVHEAMAKIMRIADAQKWPNARKCAFRDVATQLGHITDLRNDILHNGATLIGPDDWLVSNKPLIHVPEKLRERRVSTTTLRDAIADLDNINARLIALACPEIIPADSRDVFDQALVTAWQYKPSPQGHLPRKSPKGHRVQRSQPNA